MHDAHVMVLLYLECMFESIQLVFCVLFCYTDGEPAVQGVVNNFVEPEKYGWLKRDGSCIHSVQGTSTIFFLAV